jgi:hypothetical protein
VDEIRQSLRINPSNQKRYMVELQAYDYVQKVQGEKGKTHHYEITNLEEYEKLKAGISSILDKILERISKKSQSASSDQSTTSSKQK